MKNIFYLILFITFVILIFLFKNKSNFEQFYNTTRFENYGNGNKIADQVYCICMPDRREYMKQQINKLGISCVLFNAITPADLTPTDYKNLTDKSFITKKTRLPLQLSFTMCYLDAIKNNYNTIIVFEDDIEILADKDTIINGITEFKKSDFVMFYMGYCWLNCDQEIQVNGSLVNIQDYSRLFCAHSICYKVKYLKQFIDFLFPMNEEFDVKITKFFKKYNYSVCVPKQVYFDQNKELGTLNETYNLEGTVSINPPTCYF